MNSKIKFALIGTALVFAACGDYSVDSEDVMIKTSNPGNCVKNPDGSCANMDVNYYATPEDYDLETYLSLNPDVKYFQIISRLRSYDNKPRLDSVNDPVTKAEATARYNADNAAFLADEELTKKAFLMCGYPEDMWKGADSLNKEQKPAVLRFNKQQIGGEPNAAEDKAFLDNFEYDNALMEQHYAIFGVLSGRPYRVCTSADITIPSGEMAGHMVVPKERASAKTVTSIVNMADTLGASPRIMDYSAYYFCKNEADGLTYPIWNNTMAERLNRVAVVYDSLQAAAGAAPESSSSVAAPASSSSAEAEPASSESGEPTSSATAEEDPSSSESVESSSSEEGVESSSSEDAATESSSSEEAVESSSSESAGI